MEVKRIVIVTDAVDNRGNPTNGVRVGRALSRLGHSVRRVNHRKLNRAALKSADLVLAFGTLIYPKNVDEAKTIADAKRKETPFALWYFDACTPEFSHCHGKFIRIKQILPRLDWLITTDGSYPWGLYAKNHLQLMQGVDPGDFSGSTAPPEPRRFDVIFTGGINRPFHDRKSALDMLKRSFSVGIYGRGSTRCVYGQAFFAAHQLARVAFVPTPSVSIPGPYWSNRIYLAAATGTPCVVGYAEGLEKHYEDGKEVLFFHDTKELNRHVGLLIKDAALRRVIGSAARARTLSEHTYDERCKVLLSNIFPQGAVDA